MAIVNLKDSANRAILDLVRKVDPKYRKHSAIVVEARRFTNHGTYWDGGSRKLAYTVNSAGKVDMVPGPTAPAPFGGSGEPVTINIPVGGAVVTVGTFRGKTAAATVYLYTE